MRFWTKSLMARLVTYFFALSAVAVILTTLISFGILRNTLTQSIYDRLGAVATLKEDELNRWVTDQSNELNSISQDIEFVNNVTALSTFKEQSIDYQKAHDNLLDYLTVEANNYSSFQEIFLLSPVGGKIWTSTISQNEGLYRVSDSYYTQGRLNLYVQNVYTSPQTGELTMTISIPVLNSRGNLVGVLAAHVNLERLDNIVLQRAGLGNTGETYLVNRSNNFVSAARFGERKFPRGVHTEAIDSALQGISGSGLYTNYDNVPVIGVYRWLDNWQMAILAEVSQEEALEPARQLAITLSVSGLLITLLLAFATYFFARQIARPILAISGAASQVASGNLESLAPVLTRDEIGTLALTFNTMTKQIKQLVQGLEQRVTERTVDLEFSRQQTEKRALELQTIGEISSVIAGEQKLETLLPLITRLVSERFNFYHIGIFLLDDTKTYAILQAANSEGGKRMLERGHHLEVGQTGIVGFVSQTGQARIALDVGSDAAFFNNPDLPNTRSEIALPLNVSGQTIGVLDVQSEHPGAFTENDISTLSILADQITTAIENARLFTQTQQALREANALQNQYIKENWNAMAEEVVIGYHQTLAGGRKLSNTVDSDEIRQAMDHGSALVFHTDEGSAKEATMVVPIKLRGQVIGVVNIKAPTRERRWSQDEIGLSETISERLSLALENARLIENSQRQAIKEQTIGEITGKIGASINMRNVLQTAVEELGRAIPGSEVLIQFTRDDGQPRQ
jgi:GAF domain-containing protein/HAMP domain-containing protein